MTVNNNTNTTNTNDALQVNELNATILSNTAANTVTTVYSILELDNSVPLTILWKNLRMAVPVNYNSYHGDGGNNTSNNGLNAESLYEMGIDTIPEL